MNLIREQEHQAHGANYALRLYEEDNAFALVAFRLEGGAEIPISPRYAATYEVHSDYFRQHGQHICDHLLAQSVWDIDNRLYDKTPPGQSQPALNRIRENPLSRRDT